MLMKDMDTEQPDSQAETLEQAAQGTPFEGQFDGNKIRSDSQAGNELDAIIKDYSDACIQTGLNAIDGNLEPVTLPNGLTLKQAIKAWSERREAAAREAGYSSGYGRRTAERDQERYKTRRETVKRCIEALPTPKVFKGGLDNGISDQIHGYNVALADSKKAIATVNHLTSDRTGGGEEQSDD